MGKIKKSIILLMLLFGFYTYSAEKTVLKQFNVEEKAQGVDKSKVWKKYNFNLPYDTEVKITVEGTARANRGNDDDLKWAINKEIFEWGTAEVWDGRELRGKKKTVEVVRKLKKGKNNIYFWADQNPTLHTVKVEIEAKVEVKKKVAKSTLKKLEGVNIEYIKGIGVKVNWNSDKRSNGYVIYRKERTGSYGKIAQLNVPLYLDLGVEQGKLYLYKIQSLKDGKVIAEKVDVKIDIEDNRKLLIPEIVDVSFENGEVNLKWEQNQEENFVNYIIYRKADDELDYKKYTQVINSTYVDKAVEFGKTYKYQISLVNTKGREAGRTKDIEVKVKEAEYQPTGTVDLYPKEFFSGSMVKIYFSAKKSKQIRKARRKEQRKRPNEKIAPLPIQMFVHYGFNDWDANLTIEESYDPPMVYNEASGYWEYELQLPHIAKELDFVFKDETDSWDTNWAKDYKFKAAKDTTPPKKPEGMKLYERNSMIYIEWPIAVDPDIDYYEVYRSANKTYGFSNPNNVIGTNLKENFLRDFGVVGGRVYYYRIRAWDTSGNPSEFSESIEANPKTTGILLTSSCAWDPMLPLAGNNLRVYYNPKKGMLKDSKVIIIKLGVNNWDNNVKAVGNSVMQYDKIMNAWYFDYEIESSVNVVNIAFTDGMNWDTNLGMNWNISVQPDTTPPARLANVKAEPGARDINFTWSKGADKDIRGYNIYRLGEKINYDLIRENYYLYQGLEEGKYYEFSLTAVDNSDNESEVYPLSVKTLRDIITTPEFVYTASLRTTKFLRLIASIDTVSNWKLDILDNRNKVVKTYMGRGDNILVTWDLSNDNGRKIKSGSYKYKVSIVGENDILPSEVPVQIFD